MQTTKFNVAKIMFSAFDRIVNNVGTGENSGYPVCLSAKIFNVGHNFRMESDRAFMFQMCVPCGLTFSVVPRSRTSVNVKVKYPGHIFHKKLN